MKLIQKRLIFASLLILPILAGNISTANAMFVTQEECIEKIGRECSCYEIGTCEFTSDPLTVMLIPFDAIFGGLIADSPRIVLQEGTGAAISKRYDFPRE